LRRRGVNIVTEQFYLEAINRKLAFIADPFGNPYRTRGTSAVNGHREPVGDDD
jgi:hypothetical protein